MAAEAKVAKEALQKAYERLLPAFGYLHSPVAGFAASLLVFTTWLARKLGGTRMAAEIALEKDEERLITLRRRIMELQRRIEEAEKALAAETDKWVRARLERSIESYRRDLERLMEEYELVDMRIYVVSKLAELGEKDVIGKVGKIIENLEKGKATEAEYEAIRLLEQEWRNRQLTLDVVRRILESG